MSSLSFRGSQFNTLKVLRLEKQLEVSLNDMIIPHLYDWSLDGVNDYVRVSDSPSLRFTTNDFTVLSWSNMERDGSQGTLSKHWYYNSQGWEMRLKSPAINTQYWNGSAWENYGVSAGITLTGRHHVVGVRSGTSLEIYVDDELKNTAYIPSYASVGTPAPFTIGVRSAGDTCWAKGIIDEVCIYNRALSDIEISNAYNHVYNASGLVLYLDATFYSSSLGKYVDLSGNNNHGTPYGGVLRVPSDNRFVSRVVNRFSDDKVHFFIPEYTYYKILDVNDNLLEKGYSGSQILDRSFSYSGSVKLTFLNCYRG